MFGTTATRSRKNGAIFINYSYIYIIVFILPITSNNFVRRLQISILSLIEFRVTVIHKLILINSLFCQ